MDSPGTETVDPLEPTATPIRIFAPGTSVGERYEVREVLGVGGSGVVYAAYDRELRRAVALKVLRSDRTSDSALKRFRREVAVARDAQSPHLVRVFDIAQNSDSIYLTMELIDGESLRNRLQRGPLSLEETIELATQILTALDALHRLGVVHRDVKPGNILIHRDGVVKLADFGLALHVDGSESRVTETEGVVGTFEYLSPEQALGQDIDARSDLYAFGIVLFEMLTGDVPYRSDSSLGTVIAHLKGDVPNIRRRRRDIPRWLAAIVHRLIERDRGRRYVTAADVLRDLAARRAPSLRLRLPLVATLALVAVSLLIGAWLVDRYRSARFARLVRHGDYGARAIDRSGRVLWSRESVPLGVRAAEVVLSPNASPSIAAIVGGEGGADQAAIHRLTFLDAQNGKPFRQVLLPSALSVFPEFSKTFDTCGLRAVDIDHDGAQELVVSYCHNPYFPSYTNFYDPKTEAAQMVFVGAGHHRLAGTLDVDGDGRDELILAGPSNRLGWYFGVAAVRVRQTSAVPVTYAQAATPDRYYSSSSKLALAWYALVGSGGFDHAAQVSVDARARQIVVAFGDGTRQVLGPHGFAANVPSAAGNRRNVSRARSYEALQNAIRLAETDFAPKAVQSIELAVAEADRAGDDALAVWTRRTAVRVLIQAGRVQDAERRLREVMSRFDSPADACWDAAVALHQRGSLDAAFRWYREGMQLLHMPPRGRMSYEFLEGILFIHAERGEWDAALEALDAYQRARFETSVSTDRYREWLKWRKTGQFRQRMEVNQTMLDLYRYIALEAEAQLAPEADAALRAIEASTFSGVYGSLAQSLKAELLERRGERSAAVNLARESYEAVRAARNKDPAARAHFDVVAKRYTGLLERSGNVAAAREIRQRGA